MTLPDLIRQHLAALEPVAIEVIDESAQHAGHAGSLQGGGHFRLTIVSPLFAGRRTMDRHRMVYDSLAPLMKREIHAISISAATPQEIRPGISGTQTHHSSS